MGCYILLVNSRAGECDVSGLIQQIDVVFECGLGVVFVVRNDARRIEAYVVWQDCVDLLGVVRKLHSTDGSSSTQAPAARLSGTRRRFLRPLHTRPFAFSTCPLDCGCTTEA